MLLKLPMNVLKGELAKRVLDAQMDRWNTASDNYHGD
jgi:hypothetical protein